MRQVKVKKEELLTLLMSNRNAHRGEFEKAQEGYRKRMIEELDQMLEDAKAGRKIQAYVALPEPQDHTKDYDRVIKMVEMSVDPVLELDGTMFAQFVMDDWAWKAEFTATNSYYVSH
jgi:hypothetical protein